MKAKVIVAAFCLAISILLYLQINIEDAGVPGDAPAASLPDKPSVKTIQGLSGSGFSEADLKDTAGSPGVYTEETPLTMPIVGVETSVGGFMGQTERGPLEPQMITSYSQFETFYGGATDTSYLPDSVKGFFENGGKKLYVTRIISTQAATARRTLADSKRNTAAVEAVSPGLWGNRVSVKASAGTHSTAENPTLKLEVMYYENSIPVTTNSFRKFKLSLPAPKVAEAYEDVSLSTASPYSYERTVNAESKLVRIISENSTAGISPKADGEAGFLTGGSDGAAITLDDYLGGLGTNGLQALGRIDEITVLYSPDSGNITGLNQAMIDQCEALKDRIVILDDILGDTDPEPLNEFDSSYAAFYSPWLQVSGASPSQSRLVPPGGFIAGTFAQSDLLRGVYRTPADLPIKGVTGLERAISRDERDNLAYKRVNPIVNSGGMGIVAYGARTLSSDPEYKYIHVRRYMNYIEESVSEGLGWVVFESWSPALQSRIKSAINDFLYQEWVKGAILGDKPEHAYNINVYAGSAGQDDDSKQVICIETGLAVLKPAEFVCIRQSIE